MNETNFKEKVLKLFAKVVKQNDTVFYQVSIPALELIDEELFAIDRWNSKGTGYQREININHTRNIARFLQGEEGTTVLPTSVILNSRKPLIARPTTTESVVQLDLTSDILPLYITDGQHRIAALRMAESQGVDLNNYEISATITNFSVTEEIQHFRKINTSANKAPKGLDQQLASRLSSQGVGASVEQVALDRAVAITTRLATDPESPWFGRIVLGGQRKKMEVPASQSPFVRSMQDMFIRGRFSNPEEDMNDIYSIFFDFWKAIQNNFPEAFDSPSKHNIQRPAGYNAWHTVLRRIMGITLNPTREHIEASIEGMKDRLHMDSSWWEVRTGKARQTISTYGTQKAYEQLANEIWYNMPKDVLRGEVRVPSVQR